MSAPIPPDVQAYLLQAVKLVTTDQGVTFESEEGARKWLDSNFTIVCRLALEQMQTMTSKVMDNPNIMAEVSRHICRRVYDSIPKDAAPRFQQRYIDYASAHGRTPEAQLEADGQGHMANFICWASK